MIQLALCTLTEAEMYTDANREEPTLLHQSTALEHAVFFLRLRFLRLRLQGQFS